MKLLINNIGSIKKNTQALDLSKRFYVFVGANNSGKTYVSHLLWTIFNKDVIDSFSSSKEILEKIDLTLESENATIEITQEKINVILNAYALFLKDEMAKTFNIQNSEELKQTILGNIKIVFSLDKSEFEKIKRDGITGSVTINSDEDAEQPILFTIEKKENSLTVLFLDKILPEKFSLKGVSDEVINTKLKEKIEKDRNALKSRAFVSWVIKKLLNFDHDTFFLPATRSFLSVFYHYIIEYERNNSKEKSRKFQQELDKFQQELKKAKEIVDKEQRKNKEKEVLEKLNSILTNTKEQGRYTKPINELIEMIFRLNQKVEPVTKYAKLTEQIENILSGTISLPSVEGIGLIEFSFKPKTIDKSIPSYLASSSVNQLTLLLTYLKYWVKENKNFLMVDEPEENLHPKNQIKLLETFIEFINYAESDNKILITTHSPLLAEILNNYLYLDTIKKTYGSDAKEIIEECGLELLNPDISLSKEMLGVYFFEGTKIIDYENKNHAVYFRDFQKTNTAMQEDAKKLVFYLYKKEHENA